MRVLDMIRTRLLAPRKAVKLSVRDSGTPAAPAAAPASHAATQKRGRPSPSSQQGKESRGHPAPRAEPAAEPKLPRTVTNDGTVQAFSVDLSGSFRARARVVAPSPAGLVAAMRAAPAEAASPGPSNLRVRVQTEHQPLWTSSAIPVKEKLRKVK